MATVANGLRDREAGRTTTRAAAASQAPPARKQAGRHATAGNAGNAGNAS